jgi:hypothetical protein
MTNQFPESFVVQQFSEFLKTIETELSSTLDKMESLKAEDPEYGYARALGRATGHLQSLQISAQVIRETYFNA